jgi:hypothetical protein
MRGAALVALLLLSSCGSQPQLPGDDGTSGHVDLSGLSDATLPELILTIAARLPSEAGHQSRENLARSLDQKWKIECEQICRVERK